jgi:predicted nucleic acid-binding Zn ribbon protein
MSPEFLRARVIAEWRGLEEPLPKKERCSPVGDILQKLLPRLGLGERLGEEEVREAWSGIVGDFLASHATPVGLSGGVLSVQVLQPSVRYELERNWKGRILGKLQDRFGKKCVREIRFRIS